MVSAEGASHRKTSAVKAFTSSLEVIWLTAWKDTQFFLVNIEVYIWKKT